MEPSDKPIYKYLFYLVLALFISYAAFSIFSASQKMYWDFPNYYTSSKLLVQGEPVAKFYDNSWFEEQGHALGFERVVRFNPFPPATSVLMLPLTGFDPLTAKRIWIFINALLLILAIRLVKNIFSFDWPLSAFFVLLLGSSLALNFRLGQFYLAMLVLLLYAYKSYQNNQWGLSAFLLSALTIVKYLPIIFIFGFFKKRYLIIFGVTLTLLMAGQWLAFGTETMGTYIGVLFGHLNGSIDGQGQHVIAFQSFDSLLANIFVSHPTANPQPLIDWPIGKQIGKLSIIFIVGLFALKTMYKIRGLEHSLRKDLMLIIVGLGAFTVLPASASYHFVLLLFPFILLIRTLSGRVKTGQVLTLIFLFALIVNVAFINVPFNTGIRLFDLLLDYPRLWMMTGLYIYTIVLLSKIEWNISPEDHRSLSYRDFIKAN